MIYFYRRDSVLAMLPLEILFLVISFLVQSFNGSTMYSISPKTKKKGRKVIRLEEQTSCSIQ